MNRNPDEKTTVGLMIGVFCRGRHGTKEGLCPECRALLEYAEHRLDACPHKNKPKCSDCRIHCYEPGKRDAIKAVMRYSGKRMILKHPLATLSHFVRKGK